MVSDATTVLVDRFMPEGRLWRLPSNAANYQLLDREAGEYWPSDGRVSGT